MHDNTLSAIVDFVERSDADSLPADLYDIARDIFVDTMSCAVAAVDCPGARAARRYPTAPASGHAGVVIGDKRAFTTDVAAFCNTSMIRYFDYNDTFARGHPSDIIGALVAVSDEAGTSGRDLLLAIVIAYEIYERISRHMQGSAVRRLSLDQGFAVRVAAAAAIARMLRLPPEKVRHAVSGAATMGTPLRASRAGNLSHYKGVATAISSREAIFAVRLADAGITAPEAPFEGRHGAVELVDGKFGPMAIEGFDDWAIRKFGLKYFPATANCQVGVWAALELRNAVAPGDIESIELRTSEFLRHESGSEPAKWKPTTRETADHSLPYIFARALLDGRIDIHSYDTDQISDPKAASIMERTRVVMDPVIEGRWPATLEIGVIATDRQGIVHKVQASDPKGLYNNRMNRDDLYEKFATLAAENDSIRDAGSVFDTLWRISDAERAAEAVRAISGS